MTPPRATIRLLLRCNNQCVFCAQDGLAEDSPQDFDAKLREARTTSDSLTFVGGEPTLDDALPRKIAAARAAGFREIGLQTNGSRLADATYTESLARAGLTDVHLSLHGAEEAVHDYHTGREGSFRALLGGLRTARAHELAVVVTTVLTRSNFRVLASIPALLAPHRTAAWQLAVPHLAGRAERDRDRVAPRLGLALPFALHALAAAHALDLPATIAGAPLCLLGPHATKAVPGEARVHAKVCTDCSARPTCPGVDAIYLARFGGDELGPRDATTSAEAPAMFVGTGERALTASAAEPARRSLPMFGKVKPGLAEAGAGTVRRTGEELKEIFPLLFEDDANSNSGLSS